MTDTTSEMRTLEADASWITRDYTTSGCSFLPDVAWSDVAPIPYLSEYVDELQDGPYHKLDTHNRVIYKEHGEGYIAYKGCTALGGFSDGLGYFCADAPPCPSFLPISKMKWFLQYELELPFAQDLDHCQEEFDAVAPFLIKYDQTNANAKSPCIVPLYVLKLPQEVHDRYAEVMRTQVTPYQRSYLEILLSQPLGVFVYYFRGTPERFSGMPTHSVDSGLYGSRDEQTIDVDSIIDTAVQAFKLGFSLCSTEHVITSHTESNRNLSNVIWNHTSCGQCLQSQNITLDGLICDVNSITDLKGMSDVHICNHVMTTVRELNMLQVLNSPLLGNLPAAMLEGMTYLKFYGMLDHVMTRLRTEPTEKGTKIVQAVEKWSAIHEQH
ncbi:MAG: hypothetical protein AAF702_49335 [Chloroflexota bacterium]